MKVVDIHLQIMIDTSPMGMVLLSRDGTVLCHNGNHLRADPLSETSFLLESFKAFFDPPFDDQFHKLIS